MQTAKHPLDTPLSNVPSTPSAKTKAKGKRADDGLIDADRAEAASRVVAGTDGGKAKQPTSRCRTRRLP